MNRNNKTRLVQVRLTESEYDQILQEMKRRQLKTFSAYVRLCILNPLHNQNDHYRQEFHRLSFQMGKIHNQLLQLNRNLEQGTAGTDYILSAVPSSQLETALCEVTGLLDEIRKSGKEADDGGHETASSETIEGNPLPES